MAQLKYRPSHPVTSLDAQPALQQVDCAATARVLTGAVSNWMALPFDVARERYANAVRAGWIERSMLASAQFGQALSAMENLALGPWARKL